MKKRLDNLIKVFKSYPMKKKMAVSFAVPLILLCIFTTILSTPLLYKRYKTQVTYSVNKSFEQAEIYVSNHLQNMYYLSELMENYEAFHTVMSRDTVPGNRDLADAYREFYSMNAAFQEIEMMNSEYRLGIYVPDSLEYSNNNHFFYSERLIKEEPNYSEIIETLNQGKTCYLIMNDTDSDNPTNKQDYITMLKQISVYQNNSAHNHIIKIGVPVNTIKKILNSAQYSTGNILFVLDDTGQILASSDDVNDILYTPNLVCTISDEKHEQWDKVIIGNKKYYYLEKEIGIYNWKVISLIPQNDLRRETGLVSILMTFVSVILIAAIIYIATKLSNYYLGRITNLTEQMEHLKSGNMNTQIVNREDVPESRDEIDLIYDNFVDMSEKLTSMMKDHYKLGKEVKSAELKALQAQINPHFLYNTLDLINWGAMDHGAIEVANMARNLGMFYRLSLNHGKVVITIEDELKHVEAYAEIEKVHMGGALNLEIDVPDEIKKYACPNIILQPFVENSIIHGVYEHPNLFECNIRISAEPVDGDIIFSISDDGPGIPPEKLQNILLNSDSGEGHGYGVKNINFRLQLCYGEKYGVSYDPEPEEGTLVYVRIPALTQDELADKLLE